ncbi:MAG: ABC transporter permease [Bacillota bacterium]
MTIAERILHDQEQPQQAESVSLWRAGWTRLKRNRVARAAGLVLLAMHLLAIFADFVAPYSELYTNRRKFYHPPTRIHIVTQDGALSRPFVYDFRLVDRSRRIYEEDRSQPYPVRFFVRGEPYRLLWLIPTDVHLIGVDPPAGLYLLGTDDMGRDIFSRLLFGARRSLFIGVAGIAVTLLIGLIYGGISGYFGGRVDNVMMRLAEIVLAIPSFYLLVALSAVLPLNLPSQQRFFLVVLVLSLVGWPGSARAVRGLVLSLREQDFVAAARAVGATHLRIIWRHILPNTVSYAIVAATLSVPGFIIAEAALSLIGVGVQEPYASWGNMLSKATNVNSMARYPWTLVSGFAIFLAVLSYNFLGDGVREAFSPRTLAATPAAVRVSKRPSERRSWAAALRSALLRGGVPARSGPSRPA